MHAKKVLKGPKSQSLKSASRNAARLKSTGVEQAPTPRSVRREMLLLAIVTLGLCGLFLGKAYHMDDPLLVWTAQRIVQHPLDFYGFDVNWYGYYASMARTNMNPPGAAYYAALFGMLLGWSEPVLHGAMALVAVALVLGVYRLARQLGGHPLLAAGLALVSPGVLVSAGTVMTDLPMVALWVWAVALWMQGMDDPHPAQNVISALLIAVAVLIKYFAITLLPLLLVYTLLSGRRRWARAVWLMLPVLLVGLFDLYTRRLYGFGHFMEGFGLAKEYHERVALDVGRKILEGLTFLGAGGAPALFAAPWLWKRAGRIALCAGGVGIALITAVLAQSGWQPGEPQISYSWWFWLQYGLWIFAGAHIVALVLAELWKRRDRESVLLVLWLGGTLVYGMFLYYVLNIRVILPLLPIVAVLVARRLYPQIEARPPAPQRAVWWTLAAGLTLSLLVAHADLALANSERIAAERIAPEKRSGRTWFAGHWGFQYYMEERGARPIDLKHQDFRLGDTVVTPANQTNRFEARPLVASTYESFELPVCSWLTTMRAECGAGFYSDFWGPLPFVFGPVPPEQYEVLVLGRRQRPSLSR